MLVADCAVDSCEAHSLSKLCLVRGGTSLRAVHPRFLSFFPIESEEPNAITVDCREQIFLSKCEEAEEGLGFPELPWFRVDHREENRCQEYLRSVFSVLGEYLCYLQVTAINI